MNSLKVLFSNLLFALVWILGAALFFTNRTLESRGKALATANETISTLQTANDRQTTEFRALQRHEIELHQLLKHQNDTLAKLDQQNRNIADELQHALATPPAGRPDCAREPLPAGALRLLKPPTPDRGDHPGDQTPAASGVSAALPGT